ncbi:hypothetical protein BCY84_02328 [Trypanosoma cruzi cruzi]|uniref:Uncharacterized protein n=1 Tax=Trypanosoma cruzi TaxID=5693 RepID=A0A2V2VCJ8_TRYCR|nr:hypothetical protein BCY84_02328 [Trypanosoma cruzi cruzi]PWU94099.1 hypothetical protein C4B63_28g179 [Trypanosoma cruzi]
MSDGNRGIVPGTQLCYRALYATIVGDQPNDCLPGTTVKMSSDGPILVDHVMRVARRYVGGNATSKMHKVVAFAGVDSASKAMKAELLSVVEELRRQNQQYQRELETRTQQLELRKQEVQTLQNKLRVVHSEAKKRGYNFRDLADRGNQRGVEHKKSFDTDRHHGGRDSTPPRSSRIGSGMGGTGEYTRPPLPPLRVDDALSSTAAPPPSPSLQTFQLKHSHSPPSYSQESRLVAPNGTANAAPSLTSPASLDGGSVAENGVGSDMSVGASVSKNALPQLGLEEDVRGNCRDVGSGSLDTTEDTPGNHLPLTRKNGAGAPILPKQLLHENPGAMVFCHRCRLFLAPHPVSVTNHLQSEGHQKSAAASPACGTTYTQFGKLVQKMPPFIEPITVASDEQKRKVTATGNNFFEGGFDIVNSTCSICQEIITTQSYKVHESLPAHRRRAAEMKADPAV